MSESAIQIAIRNRLKFEGVRSLHIPNGGSRNVREARSLKAQGVVAGAPDLIVWKRGHGTGFLEVKAPKGRLSEAQVAMLAQLEADGIPCAVVRSVDDALAALDAWGWR